MRRWILFISLYSTLTLWALGIETIGPLLIPSVLFLLVVIIYDIPRNKYLLAPIIFAIGGLVIYQDVFGFLAFAPLFRLSRDREWSHHWQPISIQANIAIVSLIFIQSFFQNSYQFIYDNFTFTSFTENPNMIAYVLIALLGYHVTFVGANIRKWVTTLMFLMVAKSLFDSGSRNAIAPTVLLLLAFYWPDKFAVIRSKFVAMLLMFIPLIFPVLLVCLSYFDLIAEPIFQTVQRSSWMELVVFENARDLEVSLNTFIYLLTRYGFFYFCLFVVSCILFVKLRGPIPLAFFAIWLMGTFEAYIVSYSYGISIILMLIGSRNPVAKKNRFERIKNNQCVISIL